MYAIVFILQSGVLHRMFQQMFTTTHQFIYVRLLVFFFWSNIFFYYYYLLTMVKKLPGVRTIKLLKLKGDNQHCVCWEFTLMMSILCKSEGNNMA